MGDEPSLIQQRISIDRGRAVGVVMVVVFGLFAVAGVVLLVSDPGNAFRWSSEGLSVLLVVLGIGRLVRSNRRRARFEAEHGRDAGRQTPVGR
jgi:hypothetical protein